MSDEIAASAELRALLESLHQGNPRYRLLTDHSVGAEVLATREGFIVAASPRAADLLGRTRGALLGASVEELLGGVGEGEALAALLALEGRRALKRALRVRRGDGAPVTLVVTARRLADGRLQLAFSDAARPPVMAAAPGPEDPTPLITADAYHDPVTGLTSQLLVRDRLVTALAQAYRHRSRVAVLHLDLDRFSDTNASLGRDLGDRLLRSVGRRILEAVREGDTVARLDADAFLTILSGLGDADDARRVAEKVLQAVRRPHALPDREARVTGSLGVSVFPENGSDAHALLSEARAAARRAREAGGDRLEIGKSAPAPGPGGYDALELEAGLRALGSGRLNLSSTPSSPGVLHFQPIVSLTSSCITGAEALLRWQHPEHGLVVPRSFLSRSDFTGLILAIGPWILATAAARAKEWQQVEEGLRIAVNISPPELVGTQLPERVKQVLDETGLLPRLLELELPEDVISGPPRTLDVLHRLKELGVALVLDGMAVRPPALSRLSALPVDGVKLDLTSLQRRPPGAREISLLGTLSAVARALDLRVSAQGVESTEDVELLRRLGCVEAQGFHIGPPVAAPSFGERLERQALARVEDPES